MHEIYVSAEGLKKLEEKLKLLKTVKRAEIADRIDVARSYGDLSENSEYKMAKEDQTSLEAEIALLEEQFKNAKLIKKSDIQSDVVSFNSVVKVSDLEFGDEEVYTIVGALESDPSKNLISNVSPVGKALMGHKKGAIVDVHTPSGQYRLKILNIK